MARHVDRTQRMGQWVLISEGPYKLPGWVVSLMARRPYKVAAVALANKMARTIWALLVKGGTYQVPAMARE